MYYIYGYLCVTISISCRYLYPPSFSFSAWTSLDWTSGNLCRSDISDVEHQRQHHFFHVLFWHHFWRRYLERCQTSVWRNWFASVLWHLILRSSFRMSAALWWASSTNISREDHHGWGIEYGPIHHGPSRPGVARRSGHLRGDVWRPHQEVITESPSDVQGSHLDPHHERRARRTAMIDWISSGRCTDGDRHQEANIDSRTSAASVAPSEVHPASFARCDRQHVDSIGKSTDDIHTWQQLSHCVQTISEEHRKWHQERSSGMTSVTASRSSKMHTTSILKNNRIWGSSTSRETSSRPSSRIWIGSVASCGTITITFHADSLQHQSEMLYLMLAWWSCNHHYQTSIRASWPMGASNSGPVWQHQSTPSERCIEDIKITHLMSSTATLRTSTSIHRAARTHLAYHLTSSHQKVGRYRRTSSCRKSSSDETAVDKIKSEASVREERQ